MNRPIRTTAGVALAAITALAASSPALADHNDRYRATSARYDYARVVDVKPLIRSYRVEVPVRECFERPRDYDRDHRGRRASAGPGRTIAGAIIGGVVGRQFGDGSGRDAMTALGALVGASAASRDDVRRHARYRDEPVRYCETRYEYEDRDRVEGFRVTYVYDGETYTTRTEYDPGDRIRVEVKVRPVTR